MNIEQQNQARDNIKKLMEEQGLSQPKLSEKAGIAFGTLSRILRGKQDLTIQTAEKIADALGLSVYDLTETDYSPVNTSVRGYLEFNGEIKRINSFKEVEAFVRKYREDVLELPKKVREDAKLEKENTKTAKKNQVKKWNIVLDQIDKYDCTREEVVAFRKADDEQDGIVKSFGNMSPGFEFDLNGHHFFGSEQAYICGMFSDGSPKHTEIQKQLLAETNGYASKKKIRNKNDNIKRPDWETFNIEWMKYVVWNKVKGNEAFQKLLMSVPVNAMIVENSTLQTGRTAAIWGAKNKDLEEARSRAVKLLTSSPNKKVSKEEIQKTYNSINHIGTFEGKNLMGKILKLCQLALVEGRELDIDYDLLKSKNIYLLGELLTFEGKM